MTSAILSAGIDGRQGKAGIDGRQGKAGIEGHVSWNILEFFVPRSSSGWWVDGQVRRGHH